MRNLSSLPLYHFTLIFDSGNCVIGASHHLAFGRSFKCFFQSIREFTYDWWFWLIVTGVSLASTLGSKMVGLFTFLTIGTAVLVDLWDILDIRKGHSMVRKWCIMRSQKEFNGTMSISNRTTLEGTSLPGLLVSSSSPQLSIYLSFGSISLSLHTLGRATVS